MTYRLIRLSFLFPLLLLISCEANTDKVKIKNRHSQTESDPKKLHKMNIQLTSESKDCGYYLNLSKLSESFKSSYGDPTKVLVRAYTSDLALLTPESNMKDRQDLKDEGLAAHYFLAKNQDQIFNRIDKASEILSDYRLAIKSQTDCRFIEFQDGRRLQILEHSPRFLTLVDEKDKNQTWLYQVVKSGLKVVALSPAKEADLFRCEKSVRATSLQTLNFDFEAIKSAGGLELQSRLVKLLASAQLTPAELNPNEAGSAMEVPDSLWTYSLEQLRKSKANLPACEKNTVAPTTNTK